jgi:hypothetical protein
VSYPREGTSHDDSGDDPEEGRPRITMTAAEFMRLYPMQPTTEEESK